MRLVIVLTISCFVLLVSCDAKEEQKSREKRFLNFDEIFRRVSDTSDTLRGLTDTVSSQTASAFQHAFSGVSQATGALGQHAGSFRRRQFIEQEQDPERGPIRPSIKRDQGEREVETFDPEEESLPESPSHTVTDVTFNPDPLSIFFSFFTPWWEGPNVCEEISEIEEPEVQKSDSVSDGFQLFQFETTSCQPSESSYTCTKTIRSMNSKKTIVIKRQCCYGYIRRNDGRQGCSVLKMENLIDTMKILEMKKFLRWIETAGLQEQLETGNFTIFTPSNDAIVDFEDDNEDNEISAVNPAKLVDITSVVLSHIVPGFKSSENLENEELLETLNEGSKIRINKYHASQTVTANCVPISGKNNFATNGILQLTSGVLPQIPNSLGEMLENDSQFSIMKTILEKSGLMEDLKNKSQAWTVFAPTDEAFRKLPRTLLRQIESGEGCTQKILPQHLVKETICTSAVVGKLRVKNVLGNNLQLTKDEMEKLRVDGALMESENIVGLNGVIHAIDTVLIPSQSRSILKYLEEEERTDLLDLIESAGLIAELEEMENVTFFVPSKESLKNLSNETLEELKANSDFSKALILNHFSLPYTSANMFMDSKKLQTRNGNEIHLKLHEIFPGIARGATVQCAYISSYDNQACGAIMHKVNKVLVPPKGNVVELLKNMENHEVVLKLLETTDLLSKLEDDGPFTFLAPTDEAFERMDGVTLDELLGDKTKAENILKLHVLPEMLCCNGITHTSLFNQYVRSLDGSVIPVHRAMGDKIRFGRARTIQCDISATNGLVHTINRVILPHRSPLYHAFSFGLHNFF